MIFNKKLPIVLSILLVLLTILTGCLSPKYYLWQDSEDQDYESLPWSGPEKKPVVQYRSVFSPMSSRGGDNIENRWKISFFKKIPLHGDNFLNETQEFLWSNDLLNRWNVHYNGYYFTSNGDKFYEFKMVSISPTIIIVRPLNNKELLSSKKYDYKYKNIIEYGTFIKSQKNLFYFSPDLNILPQPISLSERQVKTIYWDKILNSGSIELQKRGDFIYVKRLTNKNGKNTRKDEKYNHSYHLQLIPREMEMKGIIKRSRKK